MDPAVTDAVRLTQLVKAGGCASKLPPGSLATVLSRLPRQTDSNVLVGFDTSDDAGVYRINEDQALVQTVDFFTPLVDDPFTFGQIAATNALSDIYAMGGRPISALSLVCFPQDQDLALLEQIMRGGLSKMVEAGCTVIGGHSVKDPEIKFGYAVTGLIDPRYIYTNTGSRPGDVLILTKRIGTGVITTALKQGKARPEWVHGAVASMTKLNRGAAEVVCSRDFGVHGMTDVTGFGLMGHGRELAMGSNVTLEITAAAIPLLPGAREAVALGAIPAGLIANRNFAECVVRSAADVPPDLQALLYDPQTAGGLLISSSQSRADSLLNHLIVADLPATRIGRVLERDAATSYIHLI